MFCHGLDGGLNELSEDIFSMYHLIFLYKSHSNSGILSKPCFLADMLTLLTLCDKNRVYVSLAPSYAHAEDHDKIVFYEGEQGYAKVAGAIVDDCNVFFLLWHTIQHTSKHQFYPTLHLHHKWALHWCFQR